MTPKDAESPAPDTGDDQREEPGREQPTATSAPIPQPTELSETTPTGPATAPSTATAAPATHTAGWDFGDAPDPPFPSLRESDGARHLMVRLEWLGQAVNQELDSQQVDADLYDDGVEVGELTTCQEADVQVKVSLASREDPQHPCDAEHLLYLNVLVDWDGDGAWGGEVSCPEGLVAPEWAVRNLPIDVSSWPQGSTSTAIPLRFLVGPETGEVWSRFTLSYAQVISGDDWDGRGAFTFGETEDYLVTVSARPTPSPEVGSSTAQATATRTKPSWLLPTTGSWQSLLCLSAAPVIGIALILIWAARRRRGPES